MILRLSLVVLGAVFSSSILNAATTGSTESETTGKSTFERVAEKTALNYWGVYRGAGLSDPGNALTPDPIGNLDPSTPQGVESIITAGYRFSKDGIIGANAHFNFFPATKPMGSTDAFQMLDPGILISLNNIINSNGFRLSGRLQVQLPMTKNDYLIPNHFAAAVSQFFNFSYDVPKTSLTVGLFGYLREYIQDGLAAGDVRTYKIYVAPNLNYQLSQKVAATLWVDLVQANRRGNAPFIAGLQNDPIDIEPGINWDITKNISLNPFLNIYPAHMTLAATSVQAVLVAKAF